MQHSTRKKERATACPWGRLPWLRRVALPVRLINVQFDWFVHASICASECKLESVQNKTHPHHSEEHLPVPQICLPAPVHLDRDGSLVIMRTFSLLFAAASLVS